MKIRAGFISNSSSSSFIVSCDDYKSTIDLAKAMLHIREEEWGRKSV
jgi:hypothetical protein